ncbi:MAG: right-handed parallel beta-helix repeat-containing protein [Planctomycetota bacterium]
MHRLFVIVLFAASTSISMAPSAAEEIAVSNTQELRAALSKASAGQTIRIAAGIYSGGMSVSGVKNLTIEGADKMLPPEFRGSSGGWFISRCPGLTLRNIIVRGATANGINIDDGGKGDCVTEGIAVDGVQVFEIGPRGNCDGIKCSGLDRLTIRNCLIEGWGGQGIDLVGCHNAEITNCRLVGRDGFSASAGIQMKGGTADVVVEKCHFVNAGERPLNAGGSTGADYFRPRDARYEAARLIMRNNTIEGSLCAVAFAGVDGGEFADNTILFPTKWIFRILQENTSPEFAPCRDVTIRNNQIVFRRSQVLTEVNVGPHTMPDSFRFDGNVWFAEDRPAASRPRLPVSEANGVYGRDPRTK